MTCLDFLLSFKTHYFPWSIERPCKLATNSEIRRWFKNKCVMINKEFYNWDDELPEVVESLILFPFNKKRKNTII